MMYDQLPPDGKTINDRLAILASSITYADSNYIYIDKLSNQYSYYNVTTSRAVSTTYTNTTGRPIHVSIQAGRGADTAAAASISASINGVVFGAKTTHDFNGTNYGGHNTILNFIVPQGNEYTVTVTNSIIARWWEIR